MTRWQIHYRNIVGGLMNFSEVWPDVSGPGFACRACACDLAPHRSGMSVRTGGRPQHAGAGQTLFEAGYKYMLMPDHAPSHPDDVAPDGASPRVTQGWAFQFGYIISVIQTLRVAAGEDWGAVRTNEAQPHHEAGGLSKL